MTTLEKITSQLTNEVKIKLDEDHEFNVSDSIELCGFFIDFETSGWAIYSPFIPATINDPAEGGELERFLVDIDSIEVFIDDSGDMVILTDDEISVIKSIIEDLIIFEY